MRSPRRHRLLELARQHLHFDDAHVIENNLYIRSLRNVPRSAMTAGLIALGDTRFADAADAWNNRGWAQDKTGFNNAARESDNRALAIDPKHERAVNNLALQGE